MNANAPDFINAFGSDGEVVLHAGVTGFYYGSSLALRQVNLPIYKNQITALIGPSGCGKTTLIRCFNRLHDFIKGARLDGQIMFRDRDIYAPNVDAVEIRRRIGMVFQKPNPFASSIYENIAFGPRNAGYLGSMDELVERSLRQAALWNEVKDSLGKSGLTISGGQQQRLCIARAIAMQPEVILMDEPCSALDPISTGRIEDLLWEFKQHYTIVIVTHNMQQASRVSDMTAFFNVELRPDGGRTGTLIEYNQTQVIFHQPEQQATWDYVSGRFG